MLELCWISGVYWNNATIHMQLSNHGNVSLQLVHKSWSSKSSKSKQTNKLVRMGILVRYKSLPFIISKVISSYQLSIFWTGNFMNLLNSNLPSSDVSANKIHLLHFCQGQLSNITIFNSRAYQRHGDVSLYSIHSYPRRNKSQCLGYDLHQQVRSIVLILSFFPHVIQLGASDNQSRINFKSISSKVWIRKKLFETKQVSFHIGVGQVRHYMTDYFVSLVLA